jgi:hypothetical protein
MFFIVTLFIQLLFCSAVEQNDDATIERLQQQHRAFPNPFSVPNQQLCPASALEIVTELPLPPGNVDIYGERIFFTFHPAAKHDSQPDLPNVAVTPITGGSFQAYPSTEDQNKWISVLGLRVCGDHLWLLDHADLGGNKNQRPSLFQIDLNTNQVIYQYEFSKDIAKGMLNDIVCSGGDIYIADAGISAENYAIIHFDTVTKTAIRYLENHPSTQPVDLVPIIGGTIPFDMPWKVGVDSIAVCQDNLVFSSVYATHFWTVPKTELGSASPVPLGERVSKTVSDGIVCDQEGRIYVTDFEHFALSRTDADGSKVQTLVTDESLLRWPDGITLHGNSIFVSSSAIHEVVAGDHHKKAPFHIVRLDLGLCQMEKVQL